MRLDSVDIEFETATGGSPVLYIGDSSTGTVGAPDNPKAPHLRAVYPVDGNVCKCPQPSHAIPVPKGCAVATALAAFTSNCKNKAILTFQFVPPIFVHPASSHCKDGSDIDLELVVDSSVNSSLTCTSTAPSAMDELLSGFPEDVPGLARRAACSGAQIPNRINCGPTKFSTQYLEKVRMGIGAQYPPTEFFPPATKNSPTGKRCVGAKGSHCPLGIVGVQNKS